MREIALKNWVATLTLDLQPGIKLPVNTLAKIGQTSLLGSQHVQLDAPPDPSPQLLRNGDTIPLKNSSAFPSTERVLASIATILRGGGIQNLDTIQTEINNLLTGRADQIREFLNRLDTFTDELNKQRQDITRAIDSTNRLLTIVAAAQRHAGSGADRIPAADQAFRRHARSVRRRGGRRSAGSAWLPTTRWRRRAPTCTPTCRTCSGRSSSWAGRRRTWSARSS